MMDFWFHGQRIYESTQATNKALAQRIERNRRTALEEGRAGVKKSTGPKFFKETSKLWLDMKEPTWEPNSHRIETTNLEKLLPVFGKTFVTEITPESIAAYQKDRLAKGAANKTVNLEIGTLRAVLIYCGQWARVQGSMKSPKVKMMKIREDFGRALTLQEEQKLAAECGRSRSRSLVVIFLLALYTGARFGVVRKLQWKNVDFKGRCLRWSKDKTASGDHRIIPLAQRTLDSLRMWSDNFPHREPDHYVFPTEKYGGGGHLFGAEGNQVEGIIYGTDPTKPIGSVKTAWVKAQTRARVMCRIHDLRHTAVTRMLIAGISLRQIGQIVGWSPSQEILMSRRYSHFTTAQHRLAVESIDLITAAGEDGTQYGTEDGSFPGSRTKSRPVTLPSQPCVS